MALVLMFKINLVSVQDEQRQGALLPMVIKIRAISQVFFGIVAFLQKMWGLELPVSAGAKPKSNNSLSKEERQDAERKYALERRAAKYQTAF